MNDDLIKRSDAIEAVWKPQVKPNELIFDALKTAIESEINNVPSADRPQGEWIPCDKELPALMTDVLGTDEHGHIRHVYRATRHGKSRFETVEEGMGINILAWMPLPEPYGEREGE